MPVVMGHYPHMLSEDTDVWSKVLSDPPHKFLKVWYDVHVGKSMADITVDDPVARSVAQGVSRKRIDCVVLTDKKLFVVEIKPFGNMVALGQIISYLRLFRSEFKTRLQPVPAIACYEVDPDILDDLHIFNIESWVVRSDYEI